MAYYLAEDSEALEHEKILAKLKKDVIAPETSGINWDKAKHGWTRYYDDGVVTLNVDLFFRHKKEDIEYE